MFLDDLDVDGDLDVVSAWGAPLGGGVVGLAWLENLGAGGSWITRTLVSGADSYDAVVADLDGDGDPDLVASSSRLDAVRWFRNDSIHQAACFTPRPPKRAGSRADPRP